MQNLPTNSSSASKPKRAVNIYKLTVCAVFVALFGVVSNIPLLNSINLLPGVPFSLQPLIIAIIAYLLGLKYGLTTYFTILLATLCGIPMMSNGRGGLAVFIGPTGGYIIGWFFIILLCGFYSSYIFPKFFEKNKTTPGKGLSQFIVHFLISQAFAFVGILLQYVCGSFVFILAGSQPMSNFGAVFFSNIAAFLALDLLKSVLAAILFVMIYRRPVRKYFV